MSKRYVRHCIGPAEIAIQIESTHEVMLHWDVLFPGKILRVPYERLVADQEGVTRQILKHCGLPWDPAVLDFHTSTRPVQTASLGQASSYLICACALSKPFSEETGSGLHVYFAILELQGDCKSWNAIRNIWRFVGYA